MTRPGFTDAPENATAEKPHIPDKREEFFLQTDAELLKQKEMLARVNYDKGNAVKLPSKALCLEVTTTVATWFLAQLLSYMTSACLCYTC